MRQRGTSTGSATVVVVGVDGRGMGLLRECLGTETVLPAATPYDDAMDEIRKVRPNIVITGFDADFDSAVKLGPRIQQEIGSGMILVAVASKADSDHIRSAMRAGYREYVVLPEDGALLRQAVKEAANVSLGSHEDQGQVVSVIGTKGGAGVSLLTVNLAAELSAVHRVCVVDLNFQMGDAASILDLTPKGSIVDVIHNLERLDTRMLAGTVAVHPSKVHVISQPNELNAGLEVREDEILRVLTVTADAYQYVLVDCGMRIDPAILTCTTVSDLVLLVCEPSVLSIKNTYRRLQLMNQLGIDKEAIRLVVNKYDRTSPVTVKDIEKNLSCQVAATIARDDGVCSRALDQGVLIRDVDKKAAVTRDLGAAVSLITDKATKVEREAPAPSLLGKIFK
jgi:pilus assembly protein CpaE